MKYLIVDTWNGESYSYSNGVDLKVLSNKSSAFLEACSLAFYASGNTKITVAHERQPFSNDEVNIIACRYEAGDDQGSYQVLELPDSAYGVLIEGSVNHVTLLDATEFQGKRAKLTKKCDLLESEIETGFYQGGKLDGDYHLKIINR